MLGTSTYLSPFFLKYRNYDYEFAHDNCFWCICFYVQCAKKSLSGAASVLIHPSTHWLVRNSQLSFHSSVNSPKFLLLFLSAFIPLYFEKIINSALNLPKINIFISPYDNLPNTPWLICILFLNMWFTVINRLCDFIIYVFCYCCIEIKKSRHFRERGVFVRKNIYVNTYNKYIYGNLNSMSTSLRRWNRTNKIVML